MQIQRVDMLLNAKVGLKLWDYVGLHFWWTKTWNTCFSVSFTLLIPPVQSHILHPWLASTDVHVVDHDRFNKSIPSCHHVPSFMTYWYLLILIDTYWYLLILIDTYWYLLILIDTYWYLLILIDTYWYLLILIDTYWYLLHFHFAMLTE